MVHVKPASRLLPYASHISIDSYTPEPVDVSVISPQEDVLTPKPVNLPSGNASVAGFSVASTAVNSLSSQ